MRLWVPVNFDNFLAEITLADKLFPFCSIWILMNVRTRNSELERILLIMPPNHYSITDFFAGMRLMLSLRISSTYYSAQKVRINYDNMHFLS